MTRREKRFTEVVWEFYRREGRQRLPWRHTKNPYRILVSEVMLQQTQVDRVIPRYQSFLKKFPSVRSLEEAFLGDVLREWQGLGYNRRAKMLHEAAREIRRRLKGRIPRNTEELKSLPGIGDYTAGAIMAFAYNHPVPMIETNIRTAYIHHFFQDEVDVSDAKILFIIERTLDRDNPREWYYALMDYGAHVKRLYGNQNIRSRHYVRQSVFKGSDREIRGAILRCLAEKDKMTRINLHRTLAFDAQRIDEQIESLIREGMIVLKRGLYTLP